MHWHYCRQLRYYVITTIAPTAPTIIARPRSIINECRTYVSTPDVRVEYLVLLVEVEDLNKCQSELYGDGDGRVADRTSDDPDLGVLLEQSFDESLLVRQYGPTCLTRHPYQYSPSFPPSMLRRCGQQKYVLWNAVSVPFRH